MVASSCSMRWHQSSRAVVVVLIMCRSLSQTVAGQSPRSRPVHNRYTYWRQEALGNETCSRVQEELHLRNLLVHVLHELNDEVHQLVLQHLLSVEVGNEEGNIIALPNDQQSNPSKLADSRFNLHRSASFSK